MEKHLTERTPGTTVPSNRRRLPPTTGGCPPTAGGCPPTAVGYSQAPALTLQPPSVSPPPPPQRQSVAPKKRLLKASLTVTVYHGRRGAAAPKRGPHRFSQPNEGHEMRATTAMGNRPQSLTQRTCKTPRSATSPPTAARRGRHRGGYAAVRSAEERLNVWGSPERGGSPWGCVGGRGGGPKLKGPRPGVGVPGRGGGVKLVVGVLTNNFPGILRTQTWAERGMASPLCPPV